MRFSSLACGLVVIPVLAAVGLTTACEEQGALGISTDALEVEVGGTRSLEFSGSSNVDVVSRSCAGIAELQVPSATSSGLVTVRGIAVGSCTAEFSSAEDEERPTLKITVVPARTNPAPSLPDAASPDASDASDADSGPPPICSATVAKMPGGPRDLYMAYTDLDSGPANQACPIHTSTDYRGDITFSFYSGSPGYSISGRGNYEILTAAPATNLQTTAGSSAADALEGDLVTFTFRRRIFNDQDASTPRSTWTMTFRMTPDPDPAKWRVDLFSFGAVQ